MLYDLIPDSMQMAPQYHDPVCILKRALYGHPESGPIWDKKVHKVVKACGYLPLEGSPRFFCNLKDDAESVVYADDFTVIAPAAKEAKIWAELENLSKTQLFNQTAFSVCVTTFPTLQQANVK